MAIKSEHLLIGGLLIGGALFLSNRLDKTVEGFKNAMPDFSPQVNLPQIVLPNITLPSINAPNPLEGFSPASTGGWTSGINAAFDVISSGGGGFRDTTTSTSSDFVENFNPLAITKENLPSTGDLVTSSLTGNWSPQLTLGAPVETPTTKTAPGVTVTYNQVFENQITNAIPGWTAGDQPHEVAQFTGTWQSDPVVTQVNPSGSYEETYTSGGETFVRFVPADSPTPIPTTSWSSSPAGTVNPRTGYVRKEAN